MRPVCSTCGRLIEDPEVDDDVCDGTLTFGPDPYLSEVELDNRSFWMCAGLRAGRKDDV